VVGRDCEFRFTPGRVRLLRAAPGSGSVNTRSWSTGSASPTSATAGTRQNELPDSWRRPAASASRWPVSSCLSALTPSWSRRHRSAHTGSAVAGSDGGCTVTYWPWTTPRSKPSMRQLAGW